MVPVLVTFTKYEANGAASFTRCDEGNVRPAAKVASSNCFAGARLMTGLVGAKASAYANVVYESPNPNGTTGSPVKNRWVRPGFVPRGHSVSLRKQSGRANVDGPGRMLKSKMPPHHPWMIRLARPMC